MLNQPVVNIRNSEENEFEYFELYIAVKSLEERLSPEYDITANKWLFSYFTANLDLSILKTLNYGVDFLRGIEETARLLRQNREPPGVREKGRHRHTGSRGGHLPEQRSARHRTCCHPPSPPRCGLRR